MWLEQEGSCLYFVYFMICTKKINDTRKYRVFTGLYTMYDDAMCKQWKFSMTWHY